MEEKKFEDCSYDDMLKFCVNLPKIELHAHLNGSLSLETLVELHKLKHGETGDSTMEQLERMQRYRCEDGKDWKRLAESFGLAHSLTNSPEAVRLAVARTVREFARDGCVYVELRSAPRPVPTYKDYIHTVVTSIRDSCDDAITAAYIVSLDRAWSAHIVDEVTTLAIEYHRLHPDVVVGIDLSGNPSVGKFKDFVPALERARKSGLKVSLHCGEIINPSEVESMLSTRPERVGHAVFVHPLCGGSQAAWRQLVDAAPSIAVEVCLTSNVVTGTVAAYEEHHVLHLEKEGVPFLVCTDDAGVFNTTLSREYAILARVLGRTRRTLASDTRRACAHAFAPELVKRRLELKIDQFVKSENLE